MKGFALSIIKKVGVFWMNSEMVYSQTKGSSTEHSMLLSC